MMGGSVSGKSVTEIVVPVSVISLPGGFTKVTGGGTRTKINLNRPRQPDLPLIDPLTCPFCTKPQNTVQIASTPKGWRVIENLYTPHRHHHLVLPTSCAGWDNNMLQSLGGVEEIKKALITAFLTVTQQNLLGLEIADFAHVGYSAGQNLGHIHYHLMEVLVSSPLIVNEIEDRYLIKQIGNYGIYAMGARSGECLILPKSPVRFDVDVNMIGEVISWIVERGNSKFRSMQGKAPEFMVAIRISAMGGIRYISYVPVLNPWGAPEYIFFPYENGPITLPWPHEATRNLLAD